MYGATHLREPITRTDAPGREHHKLGNFPDVIDVRIVVFTMVPLHVESLKALYTTYRSPTGQYTGILGVSRRTITRDEAKGKYYVPVLFISRRSGTGHNVSMR